MNPNPLYFDQLFAPERLKDLFPETRADQFFEALLGDAGDGAYDIGLSFAGGQSNQLSFDFQLHRRPQKCLACSLTRGLPHVLARHPVINVQGVVDAIDGILGDQASCKNWQLGETKEISTDLHIIPLVIEIE